MSSGRRPWVVLLAAGFALIPLDAAAEVTQSDFVLVREGEVVEEDLMAAGNRIQVDGRIEGDLVAAAFEEVVINGAVTGDVTAVSTRITINGEVGGSVRAASRFLTIGGSVADDVFAAAWTVQLDGSGTVGRDLTVFGRSGVLVGSVGRDVRGRYADLTLGAQVEGSVEISVGSLLIGPTTEVAGEIGYRSPREAVVEAADPGELIHRFPLAPNIRVRALQVLTLSILWLFLLAGGLIAIRVWPERLERATNAARRMAPTWLAGFGAAISPLLVLGVLALLLSFTPASAGLPLAIVFLPFAIGLGGLVLMASLAGVVPVAAAVGRRVRMNASLPGGFLLGMIVLALLVLVPVLRWVVLAAAIPLGLGAWLAPRP
ncbi:MAG TPA: polymer-forming cytoskeletal protein [Acidimicrobiia bacterium]|nr:polymer-forming cytoskeletal protein [Acidimicrobiia bacterium]